MSLEDINPHLALLQSETQTSDSDRAWDAFTAKLEHLLGHHLDGDQAADGYSIDGAHDAWRAGVTASDYALQVHAAKAGA